MAWSLDLILPPFPPFFSQLNHRTPGWICMAQYDSVETKLSGLFFPPSLRDRCFVSLARDTKSLLDLCSRPPPTGHSFTTRKRRARKEWEWKETQKWIFHNFYYISFFCRFVNARKKWAKKKKNKIPMIISTNRNVVSIHNNENILTNSCTVNYNPYILRRVVIDFTILV